MGLVSGKQKGNGWSRSGFAGISCFVVGAALVLDEIWGKPAWACGIVGYVGSDEGSRAPASQFLLEGLTILQNRGYDSAGIATLSNQGQSSSITTTKHASVGSTSDSIDILQKQAPHRHDGDLIGIAHTRWATHGAKTDENAHPHSDMNNRIALVHNGTIENCNALRKQLQSASYEFKSQTDTEVIAMLIGSYLDAGMNTLDAIHGATAQLEGTWGLCVLSKADPGKLFVARNGSPIVVGVGNGQMFVASEHTAFRRHTGSYISLQDGEIAVITSDSVSLDMSRKEEAPKEDILLSPEPYPHWTIREIHEQPQAISRALGHGGRLGPNNAIKLGGLEANEEILNKITNLVISACGTSLFAAQYGCMLMKELGIYNTCKVSDAAELTRDDMPRSGPGLLVISQSGETKDVHRAVLMAKDSGIPVFSVINSVGSLIARTTKCGAYVHAGREHAVASTKAFTTQVTVLALIAGWFRQHACSEREESPYLDSLLSSLQRLPTCTGMALRLDQQMKELAGTIQNHTDVCVVGKGFGESIAREGALKIKEITYMHAEGFAGGSFKHGPMSLIREGSPVVLLMQDDDTFQDMLHIAEEVRARKGFAIVVTNAPDKVSHVADHVIQIPSNGPLTALLAIIPLQLLAYHIAVAKGINPDKPKNLAKAVTVD